MDKKIVSLGAFILGSAIIWGAVILGCSFALKGTGCYDQIQNTLAAGAATHLILIWGPLAGLFLKPNKAEDSN
ncbi:MAG: hypothetical protein ISR87_08175 [Candidatus Marinimicrobia bacterium]|nr:hypothetical protein [FCB group bacterium]MBL7025420.1 hypothetical protein [Candidatus Neomarinimicrobiota bacterium]